MCVAKRTHRYAWHEGEKRDDFPDVRPSEWAWAWALAIVMSRLSNLGLIGPTFAIGLHFMYTIDPS